VAPLDRAVRVAVRLAAATCLTVVALVTPLPVRADCQPAAPLEVALAEAPVAFVGTVVGMGAASGARIEVAEVWIGSVPGIVEVRGMADGVRLEDDRIWVMGERYLVVPRVQGGVLRDDLCTATTVWRDELASLRPGGVPPQGGEPSSLPQGVILAAALLTLVGIAWWVVTRPDAARR
jgi:hypothetical protein